MNIKLNEYPQVLKNFIYYLSYAKDYSKNTIKAYISDISSFIKFIIEYQDLNIAFREINAFILLQIKTSDIYSFITYLNYFNDNSPYTRKRKIIAIKKFYEWLLSKYHRANNPVNGIRQCGEIIKLPKYLNLNQAKKIQNIFNQDNSKNPERDNLILIILLNTRYESRGIISFKHKQY